MICQKCGGAATYAGHSGKKYCANCNYILEEAESGTKHDQGKTEWSLLPFETLEEVAKIMMWGRDKYGHENWKQVKGGKSIFLDDAIRHIIAALSGQAKDHETGFKHISHAITSLIFSAWHGAEYEPKQMAHVEHLKENKLAFKEAPKKDRKSWMEIGGEINKYCSESVFERGKRAEQIEKKIKQILADENNLIKTTTTTDGKNARRGEAMG